MKKLQQQGGGGGLAFLNGSRGGLMRTAIMASFWTNVVLLLLKAWLAIATGSMAVLASAADSLLDLLSG